MNAHIIARRRFVGRQLVACSRRLRRVKLAKGEIKIRRDEDAALLAEINAIADDLARKADELQAQMATAAI